MKCKTITKLRTKLHLKTFNFLALARKHFINHPFKGSDNNQFCSFTDQMHEGEIETMMI